MFVFGLVWVWVHLSFQVVLAEAAFAEGDPLLDGVASLLFFRGFTFALRVRWVSMAEFSCYKLALLTRLCAANPFLVEAASSKVNGITQALWHESGERFLVVRPANEFGLIPVG